MAEENKFVITLNKFHRGLAPTWWKNALSNYGNAGHANEMRAVNVSDPTAITQGPNLADLTNGGNLGEEINFILDKFITIGQGYALGNDKLYEISGNTIVSDGDFPRTIATMTVGHSLAVMGGYLYYFYDTASGGEIGKHTLGTSTFDDDWGSTVPTGHAALEFGVRHPVAVKETLMLFGNGRYVGLYDSETDTLSPTKLDFGEGAEVSDIIFQNDYWWIAVSRMHYKNGEGSQIYLYDAAGLSSVLSDELSVGIRDIGMIRAMNGLIYITYRDSVGNRVGYISGKQIKPLGVFGANLPKYNDKTEYLGMLLMTDGTSIYSLGSIDPTLPVQFSKIADGDGCSYITALGNITSPLIARNNAVLYAISRFNVYSLYSTWTSLTFDMMKGAMSACVDYVVVLTKPLGANAKCNLYLKTNQETATSAAMSITGTAKTCHIFKKAINDIEDLRVYLDWTVGNATYDCAIREIQIVGHWKERI